MSYTQPTFHVEDVLQWSLWIFNPAGRIDSQVLGNLIVSYPQSVLASLNFKSYLGITKVTLSA